MGIYFLLVSHDIQMGGSYSYYNYKGCYFFRARQETKYCGTYTSYVSGVSSDGSLETSSVIPAMEGFFVHVSDPDRAGDVVRGQLGMSDAVRVNPFNQRQLRS